MRYKGFMIDLTTLDQNDHLLIWKKMMTYNLYLQYTLKQHFKTIIVFMKHTLCITTRRSQYTFIAW